MYTAPTAIALAVALLVIAKEKNSRYGQLYCQTGYHLQILCNGRVNGTRENRNPHAILQLTSVTANNVVIKGIVSERYLCMNRKGRLYGSKTLERECFFRERMLKNFYSVYLSCKYTRKKKKWFVGLNKKGRSRRGRKPRQIITHFTFRSVEPANLYNFRNRNWPNFDSSAIVRQRAPRKHRKKRPPDANGNR